MLEVENNATLGVVDYIVFSLMLLMSASIGVYYRCTGGKQKTTKEYLLADGNMPIIPVAFSVVVSLLSAITTLGLSSEIYSFGTMYLFITAGYIVGAAIKTYCFLPVFYNLRVTSIYEYLEHRFGVTTRIAASCVFSLQMILFNSVVLYAPSLAISAVTGLSLTGSVISVGLVCTFYSVLGGMKAILITDAFQAITMLVALMSIIIKGTIDAGGLAEMWHIAHEGGRIEFINFNPDPTIRHTFWSLLFGGIFGYLIAFAANQAQVQRLMTVSSLKKSQQAVWLSYVILVATLLLTGFTGLVVYARYFNCDPIRQGRINSFDQILPIFVMDSMSNIPGLAGLFIAGVFSASLSTISSTLNSLAAITMEDYIKPTLKCCAKQELADSKNAIISQMIAMFYGFLAVGLAFIAGDVSGLLQFTLTIFGVVGGPILGLFTLGMFFWTANEIGALTGLASGLVISMWVGFGSPKPPLPYLPTRVDGCQTFPSTYNDTIGSPNFSLHEEYFLLYRISYLWYSVIGPVVTVMVGVTISKLYKIICPEKLQKKINRNLFSPAIFRFLPKDYTNETYSPDSIAMQNRETSS